MLSAALGTMEEVVQPPVTPPLIDSNVERSKATLLDLCQVFYSNKIFGDLFLHLYIIIAMTLSIFLLLWQKVLSLEGRICDEALKLFTETKRILSANIDSGTTVLYTFFPPLL